MNNLTKKTQLNRARIKAARAAKNIPTAILLQRKKECDAIALKIVERLIEVQVDEEWMLQNLRQINRSHLEDVVEERAILKLCGYALCDNPLTKIVNKQYKISTLKNKVYDVQQTKNFCSFWCYSATKYLMDQLLTSPLWLRGEEQIPEFRTYNQPRERTKNLPGVEVNIVGIDLPVDVDEPSKTKETIKQPPHPTKDQDSDKIDETSANLNDSQEALFDDTVILEKCNIVDEILADTVEESDVCDNTDMSLSDTIILEPQCVEKQKKATTNIETLTKPVSVTESIAKEPVEDRRVGKKSKFTESTEKMKKSRERPPVSFESLTARVEKSVSEWITKNTISLLHGDVSVKQKIIENVAMQDRYGVLCKKLNSIQLEEEREDRVSNIQSNVLKPAPHFAVLKEEAETLEVKVRAFYQGNTTIEPPVAKDEAVPDDVEQETVVPLTEAHAPIALRRRIFLDRLNKVLPDLLRTLVGPGQLQLAYDVDRVASVKTLVSTFKLSATNIVFKTAEWTLVAFIIIKMLSFIDNQIKHLLSTKQAAMYISMILMSYKLDGNYLDRLVISLTTPVNYKKHDNDEL